MADIVNDPNKLTKELLRKSLIKYNVPLPGPKARKDEYVQLYKKYLIDRPKKLDISTGFSSDEEVVFVSQKSTKRVKRKSFGTRVENRALEEKLDEVEELSDAQLRKELKYLGESIGPVTDTTRGIYQKKLATLMLKTGKVEKEVEEEVAEEETEEEEEEEEEEEYSDSEPDSISTAEALLVGVCKGFRLYAEIKVAASGDAVMSRLRPRSTITTQTETRRVTRQSLANATQRTQQTKTKKTQRKRIIPVWAQILLFLLLAAFIFLVWYNMESLPAISFDHFDQPKIDTGKKIKAD